MRALLEHRRRCSVLLATALIWLVSVTLCSAKLVPGPEAMQACSNHAHHGTPATAPGCGCEAIKAFPAPAAPDAALPPTGMGSGSVFLFGDLQGRAAWVATAPEPAATTAPPLRRSFAELVLQGALPSLAPPVGA